jgi:tRNA (guanine10-N2)-methyltransferase
VPPKKPYSFLAMLDDILQFAAETLVDNGRLSFWMPTANDEDQEIAVPTHPFLEIVAVCTQIFKKCQVNPVSSPQPTHLVTDTDLRTKPGSRRLITYRRIPSAEVDPTADKARDGASFAGRTADELNPFRRGYFSRFERPDFDHDA